MIEKTHPVRLGETVEDYYVRLCILWRQYKVDDAKRGLGPTENAEMNEVGEDLDRIDAILGK